MIHLENKVIKENIENVKSLTHPKKIMHIKKWPTRIILWPMKSMQLMQILYHHNPKMYVAQKPTKFSRLM